MSDDHNSIFKRENYNRLRSLAVNSELPFPIQKIQPIKNDCVNIVLVACGSFSPITFMHLRMFGE